MEYLVNRLLERSAVKVARSVLRGGRWSNPSALPDIGLPGFRGQMVVVDVSPHAFKTCPKDAFPLPHYSNTPSPQYILILINHHSTTHQSPLTNPTF